MEQPLRTPTLTKIRQAIKWHNLPIPRAVPRPIAFRGLPVSSYGFHAKLFCKDIVKRCQHHCIPLHIPPHRYVETAGETLKSVLINFRYLHDDNRCICASVPREELTADAIAESGHLVLAGSDIDKVFGHTNGISTANTGCAVVPTEKQFCLNISQAITDHLQYHKVESATVDRMTQLSQQWASTMWRKVDHQSYFSREQVHALKQKSQGWIWGCEDHKHSRLVAYCPALHHLLFTRTFDEVPEVFQQEFGSVATMAQYINKQSKDAIRRRYTWIFRRRRRLLPGAYVLPKRKKRFGKARCIITYRSTQLEKLQRGLGRLLLDITNEVVGRNSFECPTTDAVITGLKTFAINSPESSCILIEADDLEGFFPSPS